MRWSELQPTPEIVQALEHAGLSRPEDGDQNQKRAWSKAFADGCAVAVAAQLRRSRLTGKTIRPAKLGEGTEPLTPLGAGTKKRIDVTVADPVLGLEIGVSLKGMNFRDPTNENFDKNLTGRLYELGDEVRMVHEHLPHCFMVGILFFPLESTTDKTPSSFAHAVVKLRERTGRLDAALMGHAAKCDASYVALYTLGTEPGYARGINRFFNVENAPPRRGLPQVALTLTLEEMVDQVVSMATFEHSITWSDPEQE
ncbi:MAG: hypothetical protein U5L03_06015 [Burkholderiaceae bacterium]|nr:hypothetical protein [Burkholderiaceae bacterium]